LAESRTSRRLVPEISRDSIVRDYRVASRSRHASVLGRKEVFTGKAKFGIFGDGKEVAQVAMARAFRKGDIRSGYYRDQTFMLALEMMTIEHFFAQLYAHADVEAEPSSAGRSMTAHFATRSLNPDGSWKNLAEMYNSSADVSPTGSQMPRLVGLAYASRLYRELEELAGFDRFSRNGDEIAFGTIGNASCAEGMFWESVNAIGVLKAPALLSIWDDGYGISVPNEFQVTKGDISAILAGFQREPGTRDGFDIHTVKGWDYPALVETYLGAAETVRKEHVPAIIHVTEVTQPQGHSTSGSHERYKSKERLAWEEEYDGIRKMREWIVEQKIAGADELDRIDAEDKQLVLDAKARAWDAFREPIQAELGELSGIVEGIAWRSAAKGEIEAALQGLKRQQNPHRRDLLRVAEEVAVLSHADDPESRRPLLDWQRDQHGLNAERYSSHLHSESAESALNVSEVKPVYGSESPTVRGFEVLNACFDANLARHPNLIAFGEDVGQLGDVNQGFSGLQDKYGKLRVSDTGIRECTIIGQAIGMAMRGLRPIVEIQYLDYVLYALQILSDDLATLQYRTRGGQKAPVIIRTRGHRLEGIWHAGSPMAGVIHLCRGIYVCVPRDMTRAAGFYNTLLRSDDSGMIVEVLNGYRLKEQFPANIDEFTVPLGVPEVIRPGRDVTVVTYGACCRIALDAAELLGKVGIEIEVIDVQTLLPFDVNGRIVESLKKTSRVVFVDEDVPGGATAFMMQQVIDRDGGYGWLDAEPLAVSAKAHRPAYGSDGDYFSKPNREELFRAVYGLMHEADPARYPALG
jgi:pyruvate/2-oxoglutarate/acetoin dehydrogenase E1 component/TPP-dependent pyruvate/acetoin dehydrogenase alpha subunit